MSNPFEDPRQRGESVRGRGRNRKPQQSVSPLLIAAVVIAALNLILILIAGLTEGQASRTAGSILTLLWIGVGVTLALGFSSRCKECGKMWARSHDGEETQEKKAGYGIVTRRGKTTSKGWISDTQHDTTFESRAPMKEVTTHTYYRCKYCGHVWRTTKTELVEDFDRN